VKRRFRCHDRQMALSLWTLMNAAPTLIRWTNEGPLAVIHAMKNSTYTSWSMLLSCHWPFSMFTSLQREPE
jgi:hypothetical protein